MILRTPKDLAAVVREQRRKLGLSQQKLAEKVGASRDWIIQFEKGKPSAELGLVLRTLRELGLQIRADAAETQRTGQTKPAIDLERLIKERLKGEHQ